MPTLWSASVALLAFFDLRDLTAQNTIAARSSNPATDTPTPIPALAPVERSDDDGEEPEFDVPVATGSTVLDEIDEVDEVDTVDEVDELDTADEVDESALALVENG